MNTVATSVNVDLSACAEPATTRIEIYVPREGYDHRVLDSVLYHCDLHTEQAYEFMGWDQDPEVRTVRTAVLEPVPCGRSYDFTVLCRIDEKLKAAKEDEKAAYSAGHEDGYAEGYTDGLSRALDPDSLPETTATRAAEKKEARGLRATLIVFQLGWKIGRGVKKTDYQRAVNLAVKILEERQAKEAYASGYVAGVKERLGGHHKEAGE